MRTTRRATARRLGVIAVGVVLVSGTFTGAALADSGSGSGSSPSDPIGNTVGTVINGGTSTLNNTYNFVGGTVGGVTGRVLNPDGTTYSDGTVSTDTTYNSEACDALSDQYDVQIQDIRNTAAQLNNPNNSPDDVNHLIAQLNMQRRQARSIQQTLNQLGCGTSTTDPDIGTIITNPCVVINDGDEYRRHRTRSADATCTYNRNGTATDTTTPTTLTTLTPVPNAVSSLPQSQITGSAVPTGGVNTGGFSEGP